MARLGTNQSVNKQGSLGEGKGIFLCNYQQHLGMETYINIINKKN